MNSSSRLRIFSIAIVALLTASIGLISTLNTYSSDLEVLDSRLLSVEREVALNAEEATSAALFEVENQSLDMLIVLRAQDGSISLLRDTTSGIFTAIKRNSFPTTEILQPLSARKGSMHYRYVNIGVSGGDNLLLAVDSSRIAESLRANILLTVEITFGSIVIATIVLTLYFRRIRRRDDADALARMQEFLGDASHELRTPLTVVKGYVEMLSQDQITEAEDRKRAFNRVSTEIKRMENLIHDLLLLAELGESAERESATLDLSSLLQSHTRDFVTLNPQRRIEVSIESEIYIDGASEYLTRFVQNAFTNISRHTPLDAAVTITLEQLGKKALLTIEDGGPGLPEDKYGQKVKVLKRFDSSRSRESGGSGLGMSIMSAVIMRLNGSLTFKKSSLGGLAIEVELPTTSLNTQ